jgi:lipopolysaccharide/colanic/teichoic acid biosynthesis glycosyltransferase
MYKRGYASEGLDNAKSELVRSLEQERNIIPEVIICEAKLDYTAIRSFTVFLKQHPALSSIPFMLDGSGLSDKELIACKKNTRPDEIIFLDGCEERELALLLLSPIFLLIALAIKIESRGPVFYIAKRAGKGYRIFDFFKFRTMIQGADKRVDELTHLNQYNDASIAPVFFKINNDPRITRIGSFLRNTSLDELPQLINVFLGDMSLVGNRPLPLYEAETLTTDEYATRFMAPAGITGLWQVKKRGNVNMSAEERIQIDIAYAAKCNFATDLWIIANTPSALLQKENV